MIHVNSPINKHCAIPHSVPFGEKSTSSQNIDNFMNSDGINFTRYNNAQLTDLRRRKLRLTREKIAACGTSMITLACPSGCDYVVKCRKLCYNKACVNPLCMQARSSRRNKRFRSFVSAFRVISRQRRQVLKFLTVTFPKRFTSKTKKKVYDRLFRMFCSKFNFSGRYIVEAKQKPDGYHYHVHAVVVGNFVPAHELLEYSAKIGMGYIRINAVDERKDFGTEGVSKYCSKQTNLNGEQGEAESKFSDKFLEFFYGARFEGNFGEFYGESPEEIWDKAKIEQPAVVKLRCKCCGEPLVYFETVSNWEN